MSNLWKALRDVSRDVDPTVGFEPPAHGLDAEGPMAGPPAGQEASAPPVVPEDIVASPPERPTLPRPATPVRRPLSAPRARPAGSPVPAAAVAPPESKDAMEPKEPKKRLAPLQSPLRRPLGTAVQFDPPRTNNVVRPPQFNPVEGPAPGPSWASPTRAVSETTATPPEVRPAAPSGPASSSGPARSSGPAGSPASPSPAGPPSPAPLARPRLADILESRQPAPANTVQPQGPPAGPRAPAGFRSPAFTPPPVATAPSAYVAPEIASGAAAGAARPSNGNGRPTTNGAPYSPPPGLPDALKAFAPGSPNIEMEVAAMALSPRWKPGDDDVMPSDGHKGARRPRLRDHLPW
jgi:hypothetical protein